MDYTNAISMALEAAQIRFGYYRQSPQLRYLEEANDWVEVAKIYINQEINTNIFEPYCEEFLLKEAA